MASLAVFEKLERKNTDEIGWTAVKFSTSRGVATRMLREARSRLGLLAFEPWELRVKGLCVGYIQRSGAREHLVPAEPYAHALCGVQVSGIKDMGTPDRLCPKCFRAWSEGEAKAGRGATGVQLWQRVTADTAAAPALGPTGPPASNWPDSAAPCPHVPVETQAEAALPLVIHLADHERTRTP